MASALSQPVRPLEEILAEVVHNPSTLEVVFVDTMQVSCDGEGGALGHPKVFYTIGEKGYAECGYCDRLYVYDPSRAGTSIEGGVLEGDVLSRA